MRFGEQFEFHKIPEFYNMYLNYEILKNNIELFQLKCKQGELVKLPGYYIRLKNSRVVLRLVSDERFNPDKLASEIKHQMRDAKFRNFTAGEGESQVAASPDKTHKIVRRMSVRDRPPLAGIQMTNLNRSFQQNHVLEDLERISEGSNEGEDFQPEVESVEQSQISVLSKESLRSLDKTNRLLLDTLDLEKPRNSKDGISPQSLRGRIVQNQQPRQLNSAKREIETQSIGLSTVGGLPPEVFDDIELFECVHKELRVRVQKVIHLGEKFNSGGDQSFYIQNTTFHNTQKHKEEAFKKKATMQLQASKIYNRTGHASIDKELVAFLMPHVLDKKIVVNLQNQQRSLNVSEKDKILMSEERMIRWVNQLMNEVQAIDDFYTEKMYSSIIAFIELQAQFISKSIYGFALEDDEEDGGKKQKSEKKTSAITIDLEKKVEASSNMVCPVTGTTIKLDFTGQVDRESVQQIKKELEVKDFGEMKNYKVRFLNRSSRTTNQHTPFLQRFWAYTTSFFSEHYPRTKSGKDNEIGEAGEADDLEFATNWIRAFQKIYLELKWLNAFAIINQIAVQKILKKFMKTHFRLGDNILDKNIQVKLQSNEFIRRTNLQPLIKDLKIVIADFFTDGNQVKAKSLMEGDNQRMNRKDLCVTAFFGGAVVVFFSFILLAFHFANKHGEGSVDLLGVEAANPILRFTFAIIYILFATGVCIQVFRTKEINYLHIFELDYNFKVQQNQLWRLASILLFIWSLALGMLLLPTAFAGASDQVELGADWVSTALIITFLVICLQPCFGCFYRTARFELGKVIWQIFISPFGTVRFRDFFFADVITSMGVSLVDIGLTIEYFRQSNWKTREPLVEDTSLLDSWKYVMMFLPYWWRMWQCIHKFYYQGNKMQLVNALKYVSKFGPAFAVVFGSSKKLVGEDGETLSSFWVFFFFQMLTTLFTMYWDFRWDWGLFIGTEPGRRFLRNEIKFSPSFYYVCMFTNAVFRFWWLISMLIVQAIGKQNEVIERIELFTLLSMMIEGIRRTFWAVIRVENEFFNNFEQYRDTILIPPIKDD